VTQILDKRRQYLAAQRAGIPVPRTYYPQTPAELAQLDGSLEYPVILKPYTSHIGRSRISNRKVVVVPSADELRSAFSAYADSGAPFMVQEIIPGKDDAIFCYAGFWDMQGQEQAWFTAQKLRQCPPGFGDGSYMRTIAAPQVLESSRRLLRAFHYRGLVGIEFKFDARDGRYYLIEINPRTLSSNQLGVSAGVDLAWIAYQSLAGLEPDRTQQASFQANIKYVNEEWDVQAFASLRQEGELTLAEWLRSIRGTRAWALFAWDDPLPILVGLWRFLGIALRRVSGRHT
jgi:predicted ATP-grasp superfamily ATP-dependent carboligase